MKLGIVVYSADAETVWNAFRLAVWSLKQGDSVSAFLLGRGVECESLHSERFPLRMLMEEFVDSGGAIRACGTCLKLRESDGSELCPVSTMQDLYEIVLDSDKVVSF